MYTNIFFLRLNELSIFSILPREKTIHFSELKLYEFVLGIFKSELPSLLYMVFITTMLLKIKKKKD